MINFLTSVLIYVKNILNIFIWNLYIKILNSLKIILLWVEYLLKIDFIFIKKKYFFVLHCFKNNTIKYHKKLLSLKGVFTLVLTCIIIIVKKSVLVLKYNINYVFLLLVLLKIKLCIYFLKNLIFFFKFIYIFKNWYYLKIWNKMTASCFIFIGLINQLKNFLKNWIINFFKMTLLNLFKLKYYFIEKKNELIEIGCIIYNYSKFKYNYFCEEVVFTYYYLRNWRLHMRYKFENFLKLYKKRYKFFKKIILKFTYLFKAKRILSTFWAWYMPFERKTVIVGYIEILHDKVFADELGTPRQWMHEVTTIKWYHRTFWIKFLFRRRWYRGVWAFFIVSTITSFILLNYSLAEFSFYFVNFMWYYLGYVFSPLYKLIYTNFIWKYLWLVMIYKWIYLDIIFALYQYSLDFLFIRNFYCDIVNWWFNYKRIFSWYEGWDFIFKCKRLVKLLTNELTWIYNYGDTLMYKNLHSRGRIWSKIKINWWLDFYRNHISLKLWYQNYLLIEGYRYPLFWKYYFSFFLYKWFIYKKRIYICIILSKVLQKLLLIRIGYLIILKYLKKKIKKNKYCVYFSRFFTFICFYLFFFFRNIYRLLNCFFKYFMYFYFVNYFFFYFLRSCYLSF